MQYFDEKKAEKISQEIHRIEESVNVRLKHLRKMAYGTDEALRSEAEIRLLLTENGVAEYVANAHVQALKKGGLLTAIERNGLDKIYSELRQTLNTEMTPIRRELGKYSILWSVKDGIFSFEKGDIESFVSAQSTHEIAPEYEEYISMVQEFHALALKIERYENKHALTPYVLAPKLMNTWNGGTTRISIIDDIVNNRKEENFRSFLIDKLSRLSLVV